MKMQIRKLSLLAALLAALALGGSTPALAQPDPNEQPKAENPMGQMPFGNRGDWQKMTPEERREAIRQMTEQTLRGSMAFLGFDDKALQDEVMASVTTQEAILEPVRTSHRKLAQGLMNKAVTDEQMLILTTELDVAEATARLQRQAAIAALEAKLQFSQKPKLAAFLSLSGVTGEQSAFIGGVLGNFMGAMANMAAAEQLGPAPQAAPIADDENQAAN